MTFLHFSVGVIFLKLIVSFIVCFIFPGFIKVMFGILGEYRGTRIYWKWLIPSLVIIWIL